MLYNTDTRRQSSFTPFSSVAGRKYTSASMSVSRIIVRSFSSSPVAQQLVKPPVQVFGIEGRYATALYSASTKQKCLGAVEKDLINFQNSVKQNENVKEFLKDPSIKRKAKADIIKDIGQKAGFNAATTNMISLLAENGRLDKLNRVVNCFKLIMASSRGEVICEITTAKVLDAATKSQLESTLKSFLKKGETLLLTTKEDPSILGGMLVSIGDKYIDMSIRSKLKMYTDIINTPV